MAQKATSHRFQIIPEVYTVGECILEAGGRPYLVGGWVRDALLGEPHQEDFDLEVFGLPMERLLKLLGRFGPVHQVGRHFGVLKLKTDLAEYDISVPRRESNIGKGHKGFLIETDPGMTFEEAASRRDFTINAMGYGFLEDRLLDPLGGAAHLEQGLLRHVGPAFAEDPLRVLRAMQFAGRFGFRIDPETLALCRTLDLAELPRERLWEEMKKLLLKAPRPSLGLAYAGPLGVLNIFPELQALAEPQDETGEAEPWDFSLRLVDHAADFRTGETERDLVLMTAALIFRMDGEHPGGPHQSTPRDFLHRLTNESRLISAVLALALDLETPQALFAARGAEAPGPVQRLALRVSIPFLLQGAEALHRTRHGATPFAAGAWLRERARALGVWDQQPQPLLQGRHLRAQGMPPGPGMGRLVREAFEEQLDGRLTSLDEALAWARERLGAGESSPDGAGEKRR